MELIKTLKGLLDFFVDSDSVAYAGGVNYVETELKKGKSLEELEAEIDAVKYLTHFDYGMLNAINKHSN